LDEERKLVRALKDRVRESLGMKPRQQKADLSLTHHAINNGIAPQWELPLPSDVHQDGRHEDDFIQTLLIPEDLERRANALMTRSRTWEQVIAYFWMNIYPAMRCVGPTSPELNAPPGLTER